MGAVSMGIAGSIVDAGFFEEFLGMRCEFVDMSEFTRRINEGIFDPDEYRKGTSSGPGRIARKARIIMCRKTEESGGERQGLGFCCKNDPDRPRSDGGEPKTQ